MDKILDIMLLTGVVDPTQAQNVFMVNKDCRDVLSTRLQTRKFKDIQTVVHHDGTYLNSLPNFLFAVNDLGFQYWNATVEAIVRHKGSIEVLRYVLLHGCTVTTQSILLAKELGYIDYELLLRRSAQDVILGEVEHELRLRRSNKRRTTQLLQRDSSRSLCCV